MEYKRKIKVVVTFSGGKDSLAALLLAIERWGKENITVVFCDTGWEHPLTYQYIKDIMKQLEMEIVVVSSKKYDGFMDLVRKKKRFPSSRARFCTEQLKSIPMIDWILDVDPYHTVIIQGIRKDESISRSQMYQSCKYFKYYFEPYKSNELTIRKLTARLDAGKKLTDQQVKKLEKAKKRLEDGHKDERYHTYRKNDVFAFCERYMDDVERLVFEMTGNEVLQLILDAGYKPNPLYYMGNGRVGCFPCVMVNHTELWLIIKNETWIVDQLREYEIETGQGFFPPDYIPKKYCSQSVVNKKRKKVKYPTIDDVVRYIRMKNAQGNLFDQDEDDDRSCMSYYGICE